LRGREARLEDARGESEARISAPDAVWHRLALDLRGGLGAFRSRRLLVRQNLHLGIGFLAATSAERRVDRLRFHSVDTPHGRISVMEAGSGEPLLCLHGLGGTKASFLTTVAALGQSRRVIAIDLPGFGDSDKPVMGRYDAPWFADAVVEVLDALGLETADLIGNSMGGRIAIETGLRAPERVRKLVLLSPAMAWLRHDRALSLLLRFPVPRLGLIQPTPRALVEPLVRRLVPNSNSGWVTAGLDEFLRVFCTPAGRVAFYESAANIFRDEPHGERGFWRRLSALSRDAMFVWGRQDTLVPIAFMKHVERALPAATHVELECGHVPQLEAPERTHAAVARFLDAA
ncbi:MAG TPA: alpha/beta fold hydrolase, partial [Solirubrobacterales bacterium]|nr:alpha/beta fold hydrolase [Solirubrobacterales bacterium]